MLHIIKPQEFLTFAKTYPIIDVRAPIEFGQGHIPGAHNVPLFTNEGRAVVGTIYKHQGKDGAIKHGLGLVMPRLNEIIETIQRIAPQKTVLLHCARGGMRSSSVGHILALFGYRVYLLQGGYKAYKAYVRELFAHPWNMVIVSGKTGVGKTEILHHLAQSGEQVLDLEAYARHRGSVFGGMGQQKQPTQEQFQNELGTTLHNYDSSRTLWVEDESNKIGSLLIPEALWKRMRSAPVIVIEQSLEQRIKRLVKNYGHFSGTELAQNVMRLEKHLGRDRAKVIACRLAERTFDRNDTFCIQELLQHYDKTYDYIFTKRKPRVLDTITLTDMRESVQKLTKICS